MAKTKKDKTDVQDEPGSEDRFLSGVRKALETPPKPFTPKGKAKSKGDKK